MATIRIEAVEDAATRLYAVAIYHPAEAPEPFVTTAPRYASAAMAETDIIAIISAAAQFGTAIPLAKP